MKKSFEIFWTFSILFMVWNLIRLRISLAYSPINYHIIQLYVSFATFEITRIQRYKSGMANRNSFECHNKN